MSTGSRASAPISPAVTLYWQEREIERLRELLRLSELAFEHQARRLNELQGSYIAASGEITRLTRALEAIYDGGDRGRGEHDQAKGGEHEERGSAV